VAADQHELMIPQRTMQPSMSCASEQSNPRCSQQTYRHPSQPYCLHIVTSKLLLIFHPARWG